MKPTDDQIAIAGERRLNPQTVARAGLRRVGALDILRLTGIMVPPDVTGIYIPYLGSDNFCRVRLSRSVQLPGWQRAAKYLAPKGSAPRLYVPPTLTLGDIWKADEVLITEGEIKSLHAVERGFVCLATAGVWSWKQRGPEGQKLDDLQGLLPDLKALNLQGKRVVLVYDSDLGPGHPASLAYVRLGLALRALGAKPYLLILPGPPDPKVGLDDYLLEHGAAALKGLLPMALLITPGMLTFDIRPGDPDLQLKVSLTKLAAREALEKLGATRAEVDEAVAQLWGELIRLGLDPAGAEDIRPKAPEPPKPAAQQPGLRLLKPLQEAAAEQPLESLWGPFLRRGALTLMVAPKGAGKSALVHALVGHLASGQPFLGFGPPRPLKVALLDGENDPSRIEEAVDLNAQGDWRDKMLICQRLNLSDEETRAGLLEELKVWGADLLVVDPLLCFWPVKDENRAEEARAQMTALKDLARGAGVGLLLIHHEGLRAGGPVPGPEAYAGRGSSERSNAADCVVRLLARDDLKILRVVGSRWAGELGLEVTFRAAGTWAFEVVELPPAGPRTVGELVLAILVAAGKPLRAQEVLEQARGSELRPTDRAVYKALERLARRGRVHAKGHGVYVLPEFDTSGAGIKSVEMSNCQSHHSGGGTDNSTQFDNSTHFDGRPQGVEMAQPEPAQPTDPLASLPYPLACPAHEQPPGWLTCACGAPRVITGCQDGQLEARCPNCGQLGWLIATPRVLARLAVWADGRVPVESG